MKYLRLVNNTKKNYDYLIKALQEVAWDYRVRVIKAGYGIFIKNEEAIILDNSIRCFDIERANQNLDYRVIINNDNDDLLEMEFSENGQVYFIMFKLLGKVYLAYDINEAIAWSNVIQKARIESKRFFNKSVYLERNRI